MGVRDFGLERGKSRSGYRTIHDFMVQRGRSSLWILNHPRYHGSAWKVMLWISNHPRYRGSAWKVMLCISNHPRFHGSAWKVPALEAVTKRAERANGGTRAACFEQPEGVHSGCGDAKPAMFTSCYSIYIHPRYEA